MYTLRALTNVCACDWSSLFGFQSLQFTTWNSQLIRPGASCPVELHDKNTADNREHVAAVVSLKLSTQYLENLTTVFTLAV